MSRAAGRHQSAVGDHQSAVASQPACDEDAGTVAPEPTDIRNVALTVLAILGVVLVLQYARPMLIPVVLGVLISYALDPIVTAVARARIPRALAAAVVLSALVAGGGWMMYGLSDQAAAIVDQLPEAARRVRRTFETRLPHDATAIDKVQKAATEIERAANAAATPSAPQPGVQKVQVEERAFDFGGYLVAGSLGIVTGIGQLVIILFLAFFLLSSGDLYRRKLVKIAGPSLTKKRVTLQILSEIDRQIARFLFVQLLTSAVVGVASWLAFQSLGLQQAAVWGLAAGIFNTIPYLGPVVVSGGTAAGALLQFGEIQKAVLVGVVALAITSVEGFLLTPWLTGRAARMNAVAVFVNILFWAWVWGPWGMLLAVPMLVAVKAVCDRVEDFKAVGELIGD